MMDPRSDGKPQAAGFPATDLRALDEAQVSGHGDMDPESFRRAAHAVVDLMADYLADIEQHPVFPTIEPGTIAPRFPVAPPERSLVVIVRG